MGPSENPATAIVLTNPDISERHNSPSALLHLMCNTKVFVRYRDSCKSFLGNVKICVYVEFVVTSADTVSLIALHLLNLYTTRHYLYSMNNTSLKQENSNVSESSGEKKISDTSVFRYPLKKN